MISSLSQNFDMYTLRARVYPALLAFALPIALFGVALLPLQPILALAPVATAMGALFFVSTFTRALGKRLELKLIAEWGGLPTTVALRHRETKNSIMFQERRQHLETLCGRSLPSKRQERANAAAADDAYVAAVRRVIGRVRDRKDDFPRVHEENINYGFARNLLALKPIAVPLLVMAIAGLVVLMWRTGSSAEALVLVCVYVVALLLWVFFVRRPWVHEVGNSYADRLFEALEAIVNADQEQPPNQRHQVESPAAEGA